MADNQNEAKPMYDAEPTPDQPQPAKFIRRADWGAKPPKWIKALETPIKKVVLTWTETEPCSTEAECMQRVREIQSMHMEEENVPDIKHNFLVGGDGALYEGRGFTRVGPEYDSAKSDEELTGKSIEIAFIQKHADDIARSMVDCLPTCISDGVNRNFIERTLDFIYYFDGKILNRQHVLLKDTKVQNRK